MAITVKKKKSLQLKSKADEEAAPPESEQSESDEPIADERASSSEWSYTPDIIVAICAVVIFIALILVQVLEWSYFSQPPNVWPPKVVGVSTLSSDAEDEFGDEDIIEEDAEEEGAEEEEAGAESAEEEE